MVRSTQRRRRRQVERERERGRGSVYLGTGWIRVCEGAGNAFRIARRTKGQGGFDERQRWRRSWRIIIILGCGSCCCCGWISSSYPERWFRDRSWYRPLGDGTTATTAAEEASGATPTSCGRLSFRHSSCIYAHVPIRSCSHDSGMTFGGFRCRCPKKSCSSYTLFQILIAAFLAPRVKEQLY